MARPALAWRRQLFAALMAETSVRRFRSAQIASAQGMFHVSRIMRSALPSGNVPCSIESMPARNALFAASGPCTPYIPFAITEEGAYSIAINGAWELSVPALNLTLGRRVDSMKIGLSEPKSFGLFGECGHLLVLSR